MSIHYSYSGISKPQPGTTPWNTNKLTIMTYTVHEQYSKPFFPGTLVRIKSNTIVPSLQIEEVGGIILSQQPPGYLQMPDQSFKQSVLIQEGAIWVLTSFKAMGGDRVTLKRGKIQFTLDDHHSFGVLRDSIPYSEDTFVSLILFHPFHCESVEQSNEPPKEK